MTELIIAGLCIAVFIAFITDNVNSEEAAGILTLFGVYWILINALK